jgi:hypothetical protein
MSLPVNFPLTENQIETIRSRLENVTGYAGVGIAGPMRDLKRVFQAMTWMLNRYDNYIAQYNAATGRADALRAYMLQAEPIIQGYAAGNWDGGAAANQLLNNMPQIP